MLTKAEIFDQEVAELSDNAFMHNMEAENLVTSDINISTITIMFKTDCKINNIIAIVKEKFVQSNESEFILCPSKMMNCCVFKTLVAKRCIAIKVFSNGGMHVTGCISVISAISFARSVLDIVQKCAELANVIEVANAPLALLDYNIQMINSTFYLNVPIDLAKLSGLMTLPFKYDKDIHHAMRFKSCPTGASVLLFMSGAVILTGAKNPAAIFEGFKTVVDLVDANYSVVKLESYKARKRSIPTESRSVKKIKLALASIV